MTEEIKVKKFADYKTKLTTYIGEEKVEKLFGLLGSDEKIMNAVYDGNISSGCAYDGSLIENLFHLTSFAIKYNNLLPENIQANKKSIAKVGLLCQIAKVLIYSPNDNSWEVTNRGIVYKYNDLNGALRVGERSILLLMNAGITLNEEEFEAIKILDKNVEEDNYSKLYSGTLATVIRQANEIINLINKSKIKK